MSSSLAHAVASSHTTLGKHRRAAFLALPEHRPQFEAACAGLDAPIDFISDIDEAIALAATRPPTAMCVDMLTGIRLGAEQATRLFNLPVRWPMLRCTITPDAAARYICLKPYRSGLLLEALAELLAGQAWADSNSRRDYLRLPIASRAWIRLDEERNWRRGNMLSLSGGGGFVATDSLKPPAGSPIAVELLDLPRGPLTLVGSVAWGRNWDAGPELPGFGVRFLPSDADVDLEEAIRRHPALAAC